HEGGRNAREPGRTRLGRSTWRLPSVTLRNASICALLGGSSPGPHSTRNGQYPTDIFCAVNLLSKPRPLALGGNVSKAYRGSPVVNWRRKRTPHAESQGAERASCVSMPAKPAGDLHQSGGSDVEGKRWNRADARRPRHADG